jgi:hypothetical protein
MPTFENREGWGNRFGARCGGRLQSWTIPSYDLDVFGMSIRTIETTPNPFLYSGERTRQR